MAKNKHSAALFEVIHSHKELGNSRGGFPTPKWWFKKSKPAQAPVATIDESSQLPPESVDDPTLSHSKSYTIAGSGPSAMRVDRDRNQVTMRMRFTTAVVVSFAVLVALGLAYVIGRHVAGGPDAANADTVDDTELLTPLKPVQPVTPDTTKKQTTKPPALQPRVLNVTPQPGRNGDSPGGRFGTREVTPEVIGPRQQGKNYIFIASYPPDKAEGKLVQSHLAQQACDSLNKAGVPCSLEKVPSIYFSREGWVAVISQRGYQKISAEDCQAAMHIVEGVGKTNAKFQFAPNLFQWK